MEWKGIRVCEWYYTEQLAVPENCVHWHDRQNNQRKEARFLKLVARGFLPGTPVSSPPSSVNGSANKIKLK